MISPEANTHDTVSGGQRMKPTRTSALVLAATAADSLLAGASLDQSIKQLPARRRIGVVDYSAYSRASDLGNGIAFYGTLGIGAAGLTIAAAVSAHRHEPRSRRTLPLYTAAGLAVLHSLATTRAAPTNFSQRKVAQDDEAALAEIFDHFERWQTVRAALQVLSLGAMLWAVAESMDD
jgi:hypothetical protein